MAGSGWPWRIGVAIGNWVLDLRAAGVVDADDMCHVLEASATKRQLLRRTLSEGLRRGSPTEPKWRCALVERTAVEMGLPCEIRGFTDFYSGIHHATAVGRLFRPDNPLLPNYKWVPIAYHGRTSSLLPSGRPFRRPLGQIKDADALAPTLVPTARLDYELEFGILVGAGNGLGQRVAIGDAESHIFGLTLLNDLSARDIQAWEYQPLGPFLSKNFATTVSPWIVTLEALAPFRELFQRPDGDPSPLPYLDSAQNRDSGAIGIDLSAWLQTERMRREGHPAVQLSRANSRDAYWTIAQLVAHHTVNGCNLQSGDLLGSGTLSGPDPDQGGSLLELTAGGKKPVGLPNGETRTFLADGDTIALRAACEKHGFRRIGFGECSATVLGRGDVTSTFHPASG